VVSPVGSVMKRVTGIFAVVHVAMVMVTMMVVIMFPLVQKPRAQQIHDEARHGHGNRLVEADRNGCREPKQGLVSDHESEHRQNDRAREPCEVPDLGRAEAKARIARMAPSIDIGQSGNEDAERLLVRPLEQELRGLEGVKEMRSYADQGSGSITLEFDAGADIDQALQDVREKVDQAKSELPDGTDEPIVSEVNLALFPVLVVTLSGDLPERALLAHARDLRRRVEALPSVLEVDVAGEREELFEVVIDPLLVQSYGFQLDELLTLVSRNNRLVAAGTLDTARAASP
jgi:AcrB/AcrD/AcrF family